MAQIKSIKVVFLGIILTLGFTNLSAQTCGFGCLGLSGFYGGYTFHYYKVDGLNHLINNQQLNFPQLNIPNVEYKTGKGFRVGANIFRAKFDGYFLTAKGFFQFLQEDGDVKIFDDINSLTYSSKLKFNYWGLAVDFGIPVTNYLDLKLIEGGVTLYNSEFTYKLDYNNIIENDKFKTNKSQFGYIISSGFILHLLKDYISLEGSATYNVMEIESMLNETNKSLTIDSEKLMDRGALSATIQLNIGVPL